MKRRQFLMSSSVLLGTTVSPLRWARASASSGYGPLVPVKDLTTGLPLLHLPEGFRYRTLGWTGEIMGDGRPTPSRHDGMAVVREQGSRITLLRNHEVTQGDRAIGPDELTWDPSAAGGVTRLVFDRDSETLVDSGVALSGTLTNCCGGPTPWGSWLTCEEVTIMQPDGKRGDEFATGKHHQKEHGFVFEVPAEGAPSAQPIREMGQFDHEAVAVDPASGCVYLTEDHYRHAGFYRFTPDTPGQLAAGGRLEMMAVEGHPVLQAEVPLRTPLSVSWVRIDEPGMGHSPGTTDKSGVSRQGLDKGATAFTRLEGCWHDQGHIFFTSTNGGRKRQGQIYRFDPGAQTLELMYESGAAEIMSGPDNLTVAPNGQIIVCEDGDGSDQKLLVLDRDGQLSTLALNRVILPSLTGPDDHTDSEWCGACFSADGEWLFVNIQKPGLTVAITGPWAHHRP